MSGAPRVLLAWLLLAGAPFSSATVAQDLRSSLLAPPERGAADAARRTPLAVAVENARPSVVHVFVEVAADGQPFKVERPGSGCVVDAGLVVTAWSLVQDACEADGKARAGRTVKLQLDGGHQLRAEVVAHDEAADLALLAVGNSEHGPLKPVELADSQRVMAGEPVAVLAFHDGKDRIAFAGVAALPSGATTLAGRPLPPDAFLLTDAVIDRRSHGGALLDASGRLLGVCNAEHVVPDVQEPELADLKKATFGIVVPSAAIRRAFAKELAARKASNATLLAPPAPDPADDARRGNGPAKALAAAADGIVAVWAGDGERPAPEPGDPHAKARRRGLGSGVIVSARGLVLTNAHVVEPAPSKVRVTLRDGRSFKAARVAEDQALNVALLELDLPAGAKVSPVALGDSEQVILGEHVLGAGNPYGTALTPRLGVLSARRGQGRLQADCDLGNHNGGGAMLDMSGRLIGIADGGRVDPIDMAWAMRGDDAKAETNLSTFAALGAIRGRFPELASLPAAAGDRTLRTTAITEVVERCGDALLNVYVSYSTAAADLEDNPFADKAPMILPESLGSGVIIDPSGLALTNWHVVDSATEPDGSMRRDHAVHARLRSGKTYEVRVLSISREDDLALVRLVLPPGEKVTAMELGDSAALSVGETVLAMGNPMGRANTITVGVASALDQGIKVKRRWAKLENLIETDAAINGGNSGGPLVDLAGRLVGINSAGGSGFARTAYAIAVDHVRRRLHGLLLSPAKLRSTYLGLTLASRDRPPVVMEVDAQGPAGRAGVEPGDKVLALGDEKVEWSVGFALALMDLPEGGEVELSIERGGQAMKKRLQPLGAAQWAVQRQTGLEIESLTMQADRDTVTKASLALHRAFTGDATAEPATLPAQVLRVARVFANGVDVVPGDLLLAAEVSREGAATSLVPFARAEDLQRFVNGNSEYEGGSKHVVWVFRKGKCRKIELPAKRLML